MKMRKEAVAAASAAAIIGASLSVGTVEHDSTSMHNCGGSLPCALQPPHWTLGAPWDEADGRRQGFHGGRRCHG